MNINSVNWNNLSGKDSYVFTFNGVFSFDSSKQLSSRWIQDFSSLNTQKVDVVFDATNMTDYHPMARATWQKTISQLKGNINQIWIISNSSMILAGAKMISLFTSVKIKTAKSIDHVKISELAA